MDLPVNYEKISISQRKIVREEYIKLQKGNCYYCGFPLNKKPLVEITKKIDKRIFPEHFFKWPIHLHHDHNTGLTIGAVHCECNAILYQFHGE